MIELNPKKTTLSNMRSFPWQYALYVVCLVVGFLFNKLSKSEEQKNASAEKEAEFWKEKYFLSVRETSNLKDQIIISSGLLKAVVAQTDSTLKASGTNQLKEKK